MNIIAAQHSRDELPVYIHIMHYISRTLHGRVQRPAAECGELNKPLVEGHRQGPLAVISIINDGAT